MPELNRKGVPDVPSVGLGLLAAAAVQLLVGLFAAESADWAGTVAIMGLVTGVLSAIVYAVHHHAGWGATEVPGKEHPPG